MDDTFRILPPDPVLDRARQDVRDALVARLAAIAPACDVREVGSTAVPGCIGKGDLDVLVRAPAHRFEAVRHALDAVFPRNPEQLSDAAFQGYLVPAPLGLDVAIQLTVQGGPYDDFVPFLEALRANPARVEAYNALKRRWDGQPMDAYRSAKSAFIREVLQSLRARDP